MFKKLKEKWAVGPLQLFLILCTFAIGGSLSGYLGRQVLLILPVGNKLLYIMAYVLLVTILWPVMVLAVSLFLGQFSFFKNYLKHLGKKITGNKNGFLFILSLSVFS